MARRKNALLCASVSVISISIAQASEGEASHALASDDLAVTRLPSVLGTIVSAQPTPEEIDVGEADSEPAPEIGIDSIVVEGSRNTDLRRLESDPQPYIVFDQDQLARSGTNNLGEFLGRELNAASSLDGGNLFSDSRSSISLRGLSERETLILVDGRRIAENRTSGGAISQGDINGIPLAAVERIEVLASTASGIYGGSATGGVINIILKRDYRGVDLAVTHDTSTRFDTSETRVDVSGGFALEGGKTNVSFFGSYTSGTDLKVGDRDFTENARAQIFENNPSALLNPQAPILGATTNIGSFFGSNLTLLDGTDLGSPITTVPVGYGGAATDGGAALVANAGLFNLDLAPTSQTSGTEDILRVAPEIQSFGATINRDFTDWLNVFLEGSYSDNTSSQTVPPLISSFYNIPAGAPGNPFQQEIRISLPQRGASNQIETMLETTRLGAGFTADIGKSDWFLGADMTWNKSESEQDVPTPIDFAGFNADLQSGALDFTSDVAVSALDLSDYTAPAIDATAFELPVESTLSVWALRTGGSLPWSLPGGKIKLNALLEYREETFEPTFISQPYDSFGNVNQTTFTAPEQSQDIFSFYSELIFPLVSPQNSVPGIWALEFRTAARYDDYNIDASEVLVDADIDGAPLTDVATTSLEFSEVSPTFALKYSPFESFAVRSSYGEGYLPPSLEDLVANPNPVLLPIFFFPLLGITDPLRGDEFLGTGNSTGLIVQTFGGSPDLEPEQSTSWSVGVIYEPLWLENLRISVDWIRIEKEDAIIPGVSLTDAAEVAAVIENRPDRITRDPAAPDDPFGVGPITAVDFTAINFSEEKIEAIDYSLDYTLNTDRFGDFVLTADLTHNLKAERTFIPGTEPLDRVGTSNLVKFRGTAGLRWLYNNWTAQWSTQYVDSISLDQGQPGDEFVIASQGSDEIDSQTYHDLYLSYTTGKTEGPLRNTTFQAGLINVFDTEPPFSAVDVLGTGVAPYGDVRLSRIRFSVQKSF